MFFVYLDSLEELTTAKNLIRYFVVEQSETTISLYGVGDKEIFVLKDLRKTQLEKIKAELGLRTYINGKLVV